MRRPQSIAASISRLLPRGASLQEKSPGAAPAHRDGSTLFDDAMRRLVGVLAALAGLVVLSPLLLLLAIAVKLQDGGPALYLATRVGKDGKLFTLYKFRTMVVNAEQLGAGITTSGDARITRVGRWLRRTKLDELPQLINVLLGDMDLVGPRPEDPRYVAFYTLAQRQLLLVRPGITSPASLEYRAEEETLAGPDWETTYCQHVMPDKLTIDLHYLARRTLSSDIEVILQTISSIVAGSHRSTFSD
jgi:lipopolysaccharide/colanic/teichoic acid biosynthesis glycosyltransferase